MKKIILVIGLVFSGACCLSACGDFETKKFTKEEFGRAIIATLSSENLTFDMTINGNSFSEPISIGMKLDFDNDRFYIYHGESAQKEETYYFVENGVYKILSFTGGTLSSKEAYTEEKWRAQFEEVFYGVDIAPFNIISIVREYKKFNFNPQDNTYTYSAFGGTLVLKFDGGLMVSADLTTGDYISDYKYSGVGTTVITVPDTNS